MPARIIDVSVISDLHLATHACKAKKVLKYLKSIEPKTLILNGDIIDSWRFSRNYFPKSHLKVVRQLIKMLEKGIHIFYISGNHDEFLRKFNPAQFGNLNIVNQLILELDGKKTWIFHGDIFDHTIHQAKWLAKLGAAGYGFLSIVNKLINTVVILFSEDEFIIYRSFKKRSRKGKTHITKFETTISKIALSRGYQTVICGHTHIPADKLIHINEETIRYLNCGDWVENLTAVEYYDKTWNLVYFDDIDDDLTPDEFDFSDNKQIFSSLFKEIASANVF